MTVSFETDRLKVFNASDGLDPFDYETLSAQIPDLLTPSVVQNLPPYFHGVDSKERAQLWLDQMLGDSHLYLVALKDDELIGFVFAYSENDRDAHIGYLLAEEHWGKGLASELLRGFIQHVSTIERWVKLIGGVDKTNIASTRLLTKLGFSEQSTGDGDVAFYEYVIPQLHS